MTFFRIAIPIALLLLALVALRGAEGAEGDKVSTWTDPKQAREARSEFSVQGEYVQRGKDAAIGLQVADMDGGKFHVLRYSGGLPGDGWDGSSIKASLLTHEEVESLIEGFQRVQRSSPTLGQVAPAGAMVIFDGEKTEHIQGEIEGGLLWAGSKMITPVGDFQLHVEFRLPYKPSRPLSHQDRGNSGLYIFDNYEVQILDSFGLDFDTENNAIPTVSLNAQWCGSFYKEKTPDVPMAFPPLAWQTYDIEFTAPKFEGDEKVSNARVTVKHNGVVIHEGVELKKGTGAGGKRPEKAKGPIQFQGHGNPVAFRNVWVLPKNS
ncbi:MAG: DUF1080 domain-containing protein [Verrucomicrobiota bacterium]